MKQMIAADRRDEHIGQAVVVIIADGYPHAVSADVQPGALGHIGEVAMTIVVVERHGWRRLSHGDMARPIARVDKQQVLETIVVKVKKRHAPTHGFRQELVAIGPVHMSESDSRLPGDSVNFATGISAPELGGGKGGLPRQAQRKHQQAQAAQIKKAKPGFLTGLERNKLATL